MLVDHGDAPVFDHLLEPLAILFVADTLDGMSTMMLLFPHLQSLHQDLVGRAAHGATFAPVQVVDPPAGHAAQPATGLDEDDFGPLFLSGQGCHDTTRRAAIHTDVYLVERRFCRQTVLPDQ